jgi:hypothetical protein
LVLVVIVAVLLGIGFVAGRLVAPVVVREVPAETEPIVATLLPQPALAGESGGPSVRDPDLALDTELPGLTSPRSIPRQTRLPWRDWQVDPSAYDLTSSSNMQVSLLNRDNMAEYSRRIIDSRSLQRAPSPELYYVKRRTPAYDKLARFGDHPVGFLMPGTPLLIQQFDSRWALVMPPGREALWVRAPALTTERTHRSWY